MGIDESLHQLHGLRGIGLVQFYFRRLLVIAKGTHIIALFRSGAGREILHEGLEQVLCIQVVLLVVIGIRELVIHVLVTGSTLHIGEYIFKELLGVPILLVGIVLFSHFVLILIILALHDLTKLIGT